MKANGGFKKALVTRETIIRTIKLINITTPFSSYGGKHAN